MKRTFSILFVFIAVAFSISAQSEAGLRSNFEGKSVTVRIDMPTASESVDIYPERSQSLDYNRYNQRLVGNGAGIHRGQTATITKVRVKGNQIEVQLRADQQVARFNIHYTRIESWMLSSAGLVDALNRFVEFSELDKRAARSTDSAGYIRNGVIHVGPPTTYLKEGLKTAEVLKLLGEPSTISKTTVDGKVVSTYEFERSEGRVVVAKFVSDLLISSRTEIRTAAVASNVGNQ